jgi:membrane protein implicated in regulation of membrane protease activity
MYKNMSRIYSVTVFLIILSLFFQGTYAQTSPPNEGNWEIDSRVVITDSTIVLNGDLIVHRGGELELHDVILRMNCESDREYKIKVENGGKLEIYDSEISSNTGYQYAIVVDTEGEFEIHNSTVIDYTTYDLFSIEENAVVMFFLGLSIVGIAIVLLLIIFFMYIRKQRHVVTTTSESLIGKEGMVLERVEPNNFKGKVKVESRVWSATSEEVIEKNEKVGIVDIKGINVIVERHK